MMTSGNPHIVSKCHWETAFDNREQSQGLQDQISQWSTHHLPRELGRVLDRFFDPLLTVRFNTLEVDLGVIAKEVLPAELNKRFATALAEQLKDQLFAPGAFEEAPSQQDQRVSQLEVLAYYLTHGLFPWQYHQRTGIHALVESTLSTNKVELVGLVRQLGRQEQVRRRLAWQLEDKHIKSIVKGLEPGHHLFIFQFTERLIRVQKQQKVVTQNVSDFKQDVWYWTLTHLIVERGSVFNKKAYMKSSLIQLANRHQLGYNELLLGIKHALQETLPQVSGQSELVRILIALIQEAPDSQDYQSGRTGTHELDWPSPSDQLGINVFFEAIFSGQITVHWSKLWSARSMDAYYAQLMPRNQWRLIEWMMKTRYPDLNNLILLSTPAERKRWVQDRDWVDWKQELEEVELSSSSQWISISSSILFQQRDTWTLIERSMLLFYQLKIETLREALICEAFTARLIRQFLQEDSSKLYPRLKRLLLSAVKATDSSSLEVVKKVLDQWAKVNPEGLMRFLKDPAAREVRVDFLLRLLKPEIQKKLIRHLPDDFQTFHRHILACFPEDHHVFWTFRYLSLTLESEGSFTRVIERIWPKLMAGLVNLAPEKFLTLHTYLHSLTDVEKYVREIEAWSKALQPKDQADWFTQLLERKDKRLVRELLQQVVRRDRWLVHLPKGAKKKLFQLMIPGADHGFDHYIRIYGHLLKLPHVSEQDFKRILDRLLIHCLSYETYHQGELARFESLLAETITYHFKIDPSVSPIVPELTVSGFEDQLFEAMEACLTSGKTKATINRKRWTLQDMLLKGLDLSPEKVRTLLSSLPHADRNAPLLAVQVDFRAFVSLLFADGKATGTRVMEDLCWLLRLIDELASPDFSAALLPDFWRHVLKALKPNGLQTGLLQTLVSLTLDRLVSNYAHIDAYYLNEQLAVKGIKVPEAIDRWFRKHQIQGHEVAVPTVLRELNHVSAALAEQVMRHLLEKGYLPTWYPAQDNQPDAIRILELWAKYPLVFVTVYRQIGPSDLVMTRLSQHIHFDDLLVMLGRRYPTRYVLLEDLKQLHLALSQAHLPFAPQIAPMFFQGVLDAWAFGQWVEWEAGQFWKKWLSTFLFTSTTGIEELMSVVRQVADALPVKYRLSLERYVAMAEPNVQTAMETPPKEKPIFREKEMMQQTLEGIFISNAGIVLLNSFFKILFDRLDLLEDQVFKSREAQLLAVHYLQYMVLGEQESEESDLVLNKLLVGLPLAEPVKRSVKLPESDRELIDDMLQAAIGYWPAVGATSIQGFHGNWFVREGMLYEKEDYWNLVVEKRVYDLLLNQSPFSFSIIKFPWMPKPLKVDWPY